MAPQAEPEPACPAPGTAKLPESVAADGFVATAGLELESCGREYIDSRTSCCEPLEAGYECFLRAFESCTPVRFAEVYSTIEGDLILRDYFVVPAGSGCELMVMTDRSEDAFRDPSAAAVQTQYCATASLRFPVDGQCPSLALDDCGD